MQPVCTLHAAWHHAGMMPTQPSNPNVKCQKSNVLACVDVQFSSGPLYAYKGHMPGPLFVELISKRPLGCPISLAVMVQCINSVQRQVKWGGLNHTVLAWDSLFAFAHMRTALLSLQILGAVHCSAKHKFLSSS
jgi:hypothetical protein